MGVPVQLTSATSDLTSRIRFESGALRI